MYVTAYTGIKLWRCCHYQHSSKLADTDPVHQGLWREPAHHGDISVPVLLCPMCINGTMVPVVLNPEFPTGI